MSGETLDNEISIEGFHWSMNQEVAFVILNDMKYNTLGIFATIPVVPVTETAVPA
jgi:hypothetical protein